MGRPPKPAIERFLAKVKKTRGCWIWLGYCDKFGYGQFWPTWKSPEYAHRWAYKHFKGEIPGDRCVLHSCDNPSCVNPKHLKLGTQLENQQQKWARNRGVRCIGKRNGMFGKRPWNKGRRWPAAIRKKISRAARRRYAH